MIPSLFHKKRSPDRSRAYAPAGFTVEASLLLPPVLLVLLLLLYLIAHIHNRSVLSSAACAWAVTGREQEISALFLEDSYEAVPEEDKQKRTVTWKLRTLPLLFSGKWEDSASLVYERTDTVRILQLIGAARKTVPPSS